VFNHIKYRGAAFEGVLRPHMIVQNGRVRDSALFSITKDDWSTVKRQLQQRLDRRIASTG
jgi:N-acetyltransferase